MHGNEFISFSFSLHINSSCNFIMLVPFTTHHIIINYAVISNWRNTFVFESTLSVSVLFIAGRVHFGVGNYKAEGKYTFEKGRHQNVRIVSYYSPLNSGPLRKHSFDPHKLLSQEVMCRLQSEPLQQILPVSASWVWEWV